MRQLVWEKENSEFKPFKLRLKIDFVSYLARVKGLVNRIIFHNKRPDRKWGWNMDDVMPRKMVQRVWGFWKGSWGRPLKMSFSDLIRSDQIFGSRPAEMNYDNEHHKMLLACVSGGQHRMVSIGFYNLYLSPRVAKDWNQKLINPFVSETTESACICICISISIFLMIAPNRCNMFDLVHGDLLCLLQKEK